MNKSRFDEHWPHYLEGGAFSDGEKLKELSEEHTRGLKTLALLKFAMGAGGLAWALGGDDPMRAAAVMAALSFLYISHVSAKVGEQSTKIRKELEIIKGSIRENRFMLIERTKRSQSDTSEMM